MYEALSRPHKAHTSEIWAIYSKQVKAQKWICEDFLNP